MTRWRCGGGQRRDQGAGIEIEPEVAEQLGGAGAKRLLADQHAVAEIGAAGEDVLGDGELLEDLGLLRHVGDAVGARLARVSRTAPACRRRGSRPRSCRRRARR